MHFLPLRHSFKLVRRAHEESAGHSFQRRALPLVSTTSAPHADRAAQNVRDQHRRLFLKALGGIGLGVVGASIFPKKTSAIVMGGTPSTSVVGVKDSTNTRINPATEETLEALAAGTAVLKKSVSLTSSGIVHTPTSTKKIRVYNIKFSLTADMTSVSFRFAAGGTDFEKYLAPKTGGLYGIKNHPNYVEGGADQDLYCAINGTGTVQINVDYIEV